MTDVFDPREQAARCRRLARDCTDASLRHRLLELADEYAARAAARETLEIGIDGHSRDDSGIT